MGPPGVKVPVPGSHSKVSDLPLREVDAAAERSTVWPVTTWLVAGVRRAVGWSATTLMTAVAVSFWPVADVARTRMVWVPGVFQCPVQVGPPGVKVPVPGSHSKVSGLPLREVDAAADRSTVWPVRTWEVDGVILAVARSWSVEAWTDAPTGQPPQSL